LTFLLISFSENVKITRVRHFPALDCSGGRGCPPTANLARRSEYIPWKALTS